MLPSPLLHHITSKQPSIFLLHSLHPFWVLMFPRPPSHILQVLSLFLALVSQNHLLHLVIFILSSVYHLSMIAIPLSCSLIRINKGTYPHIHHLRIIPIILPPSLHIIHLLTLIPLLLKALWIPKYKLINLNIHMNQELLMSPLKYMLKKIKSKIQIKSAGLKGPPKKKSKPSRSQRK